MTTIILRDLKLPCLIGIDTAERQVRQTLLLDADITVAVAPNDDTAPVVNYRTLVEKLRQLAATSDFGLMENFAAQAAALLCAEQSVGGVRVYCRKPKPFADLGEAGVEARLP